MNLESQLAACRRESLDGTPAPQVAQLLRSLETVRAGGAIRGALHRGDSAPLFTLPDGRGRPVSLAARLARGPVVVSFYRGRWCTYCSLELQAYREAAPRIRQLGASLLAVSPARIDAPVAELAEGGFELLHDAGNRVARRFGIAFRLPPALQDLYQQAGVDLPTINGDDSWELPVPATYVIAPDGIIVLAYVEVDYRERLDPKTVLEVLEH